MMGFTSLSEVTKYERYRSEQEKKKCGHPNFVPPDIISKKIRRKISYGFVWSTPLHSTINRRIPTLFRQQNDAQTTNTVKMNHSLSKTTIESIRIRILRRLFACVTAIPMVLCSIQLGRKKEMRIVAHEYSLVMYRFVTNRTLWLHFEAMSLMNMRSICSTYFLE